MKLCHVCGDKAIAFNFNGLTCESCKSFFRRNAFKIHKFKCNRNNNCRIELYNRKYCQFCRLQKCFDIGMKKELVLDRKRKHERNAALKQVELIRIVRDIDGNESATNALLVELLAKFDPEFGPNSNSSNSNSTTKSVIEEEEENEEADDDFSLLDAFPGFATDQFELNKYEQNLINEVNLASSVFTEELSLQVRGEAKSFRESCNLPALYIRKIIRFCKNVVQFKMINKENQLLIIKPYFTEILLIRFAFAYNYEHDAISVIENEIEQNAIWVKIDLLKEANRHSFALVYRKFMFQSKMEMESDVTTRNILATILMFRSRENISCPEFIRYSHILYKRLLSRYLEAKYREKAKAEEKYEKLMHVLERACDITHSYSELYTLLDIKEVTGVLKEIYDLK